MDTRRALTILSGMLAAAATAMAFRLFPADLSSPITWLWIPLFAGMVFTNTFGLAAIVLMVPWEIITHYHTRREQLHVIDAAKPSGEITTTTPAFASKGVA